MVTKVHDSYYAGQFLTGSLNYFELATGDTLVTDAQAVAVATRATADLDLAALELAQADLDMDPLNPALILARDAAKDTWMISDAAATAAEAAAEAALNDKYREIAQIAGTRATVVILGEWQAEVIRVAIENNQAWPNPVHAEPYGTPDPAEHHGILDLEDALNLGAFSTWVVTSFVF
jgi:hypothetical protein